MRRTWEIDGHIDESGNIYPPDDNEVARSLIDIRPLLERLGGYVVVAPKRVKFPDGSFETAGFVFKYDSSMPAAEIPKGRRAESESPLPEPPAEPSPEAAAELDLEPALAE